MAEMGRAKEAAELQATIDRAFRGRRWWMFSVLRAWSRAMLSLLSGDRRAGVEPLTRLTEDAVANGYWLWGRFMLADLAESAVYSRNDTLARHANELLAGDPAPPSGRPNEGLRALVAGTAAFASGQVEEAAHAFEQSAGDFEAGGWTLFEGRALALLGHCSGRADRERATDALERAAALFEGCQAAVRRQEALAALSATWLEGTPEEGGAASVLAR